jgi:hypothetical protein
MMTTRRHQLRIESTIIVVVFTAFDAGHHPLRTTSCKPLELLAFSYNLVDRVSHIRDVVARVVEKHGEWERPLGTTQIKQK